MIISMPIRSSVNYDRFCSQGYKEMIVTVVVLSHLTKVWLATILSICVLELEVEIISEWWWKVVLAKLEEDVDACDRR